MTLQPTLLVDHDTGEVGSAYVGVRNLDPNLVEFLDRHPQAGHLLQSILRVRVAGADEDLPDVLGRYRVVEGGVRFIPRFPFESGVRYRASFDPRPLGRCEQSEVLTLEFSLPNKSTEPTQVTDVFPSTNVLPENLLRFYVCFSNSMQRGQAEEQIRLLGPDGRPSPDVLYRPPLELWDRSMRHLTILLDPGRLKHWVGPNRELGPPLKVGQQYTLAIGSGMVDFSGRSLGQSFYKPFLVTEAVRERITIAHWKILPPPTKSRQPLAIVFPKPLDWALLRPKSLGSAPHAKAKQRTRSCEITSAEFSIAYQIRTNRRMTGYAAITISLEGGLPILVRIAIDQDERQWSFTPTSPWVAGWYSIRVASDLEDVCGNGLLAAFDRPLRSGSDLAIEMNCSFPFHLTQGAGQIRRPRHGRFAPDSNEISEIGAGSL
jgi:hypothetical protein